MENGAMIIMVYLKQPTHLMLTHLPPLVITPPISNLFSASAILALQSQLLYKPQLPSFEIAASTSPQPQPLPLLA